MSVQAAPERTVAYYNRLIIWATLLFITLGLFFQSLHINIFTQQNLDNNYTEAMASQLALGLSLKIQESQNQLTNAADHIRTRNSLEQEDLLWQNTLLTLINGANEIHIMDRRATRNIGLKLGSKARRLAMEVLQGKEIPITALDHRQQQKYLAMAAVKDASSAIQGVIIVEYSSAWIQQLQQEVAPERGHIELNQVLTAKPTLLFSIGNIPENPEAITSHPINEQWFLTFTPDEARPQLSLTPIIAPWIIALLTTLASLSWFAWAQNGAIRENQFLLITYVRGLFRNQKDQRPEFTIKLFHELADSMAELANAKGLKVASSKRPTQQPTAKNASVETQKKSHRKNAAQPQDHNTGKRPEAGKKVSKASDFEYQHTAPQLEVEEVEH